MHNKTRAMPHHGYKICLLYFSSNPPDYQNGLILIPLETMSDLQILRDLPFLQKSVKKYGNVLYLK